MHLTPFAKQQHKVLIFDDINVNYFVQTGLRPLQPVCFDHKIIILARIEPGPHARSIANITAAPLRQSPDLGCLDLLIYAACNFIFVIFIHNKYNNL